MLAGFTGWHFVIIAVVVLILFGGATRLPMFAKGLGQSIKIFKKEVDEVRDDSKAKTRDEPAEPVYYTAEPPKESDSRTPGSTRS
ncbi:MAG TPA: twin-arginine translocase TatA/TatE family subunit [Amnibacterium sp.]|jgi:sec-independent protein translocase protein TatA